MDGIRLFSCPIFNIDKCILKGIIKVKPELKHCKIYFWQQVTNIFANLVPLKQTFEQGSAAVCKTTFKSQLNLHSQLKKSQGYLNLFLMLKSNDINFVKDQNSYKSFAYGWLPSPALNKHLKCLFRKANSLQIIFKAKWKAEKEKIIFHPFFIYVQIYCLITFYFVYPETKDRRTYNHKNIIIIRSCTISTKYKVLEYSAFITGATINNK